MEINNLFSKKNFTFKEGVYIFDKNDNYTSNFGKQWKDFQNVQIDSLNKNNISFKFLNRILFNQMSILNDKTILEMRRGSGRFTEYLVKSSKLCVSVDLSAAIFYNVSKKNKNLILVKSDLMNLDFKTKFDIVICRGVIQHTPNPRETIKKNSLFC